MSVESDLKKINKALNSYEKLLTQVTEAEFQTTPPIGGWSYSEVFSHLYEANYLSSIAIEKCLNKTADFKPRKADWRVRLILFLGALPPGKYKAPKVIAESVRIISLEEAANQILKIRKKLSQKLAAFAKCDSSYKFKHPRLGYLDAKQWMRFILIHTLHHQKQLKRIAKSLHQKHI